MKQKLNAVRTEQKINLHNSVTKRKCGKIQFIYLCPVEGMVMYLPDAVVVQVPAISQKIVMIKGEKLLSH